MVTWCGQVFPLAQEAQLRWAVEKLTPRIASQAALARFSLG